MSPEQEVDNIIKKIERDEALKSELKNRIREAGATLTSIVNDCERLGFDVDIDITEHKFFRGFSSRIEKVKHVTITAIKHKTEHL